MVELQPAQFVPPADADEDAINQVINNGIRTEFHPSGTLAMLPLEQGGVVDSHLLVWGMSRSTFLIIFIEVAQKHIFGAGIPFSYPKPSDDSYFFLIKPC